MATTSRKKVIIIIDQYKLGQDTDARLELVLCNKRGRDSERTVHRDEEWPPLATTREKPSHRNEDPTQPKIN